jgi:hypothetical protein
MEEISNTHLITTMLTALYKVTSRRTSIKFADETIGASIKTLEKRFDFLKYIQKNTLDPSDETFGITVAPTFDTVDPAQVGKAIEALLRVVYTDLDDNGGLYFISELKLHAGEPIINHIQQHNIDLDQLQIEQHYAFRRRERKRPSSPGAIQTNEPLNQLGYTWETVSSWKHEEGSPFCVLYAKDGTILDRLNLDTIIQDYIERLSGYAGKDEQEFEDEIHIYEKEYQLLELMLSHDMDLETAAHHLHMTPDQITEIIRTLAQIEMVHYTSFDEVILTKKGIHYLNQQKKK